MTFMKIGVIGTIGEGESTSSGQEIRTRILLDSLKKYYGENSICLINTGLLKKTKAKALFSLFRSLLICNDFILIVSRNGLHTFLPFLSFCHIFLRKRIYNNIIGGNILELIKDNPKYPQYMKTFEVNWVQMNSLATGLQKKGLTNVEVLPNSKPIKTICFPHNYRTDGPVSFCTFSRISKAKGIELAISAIEELNREEKKTVATLDIYGKPDEDYKEEFETVMTHTSDAIRYGGVIPFDQSTEVLSKYFMLLFPTTFYGEGFPGTILDAYASGLPVLASDWKFNPELISDGVTGFLYDHTSEQDFKEKLKYSIAEKDKVNKMRIKCLREAEKYTPENVMPIVFNKIDSIRGATL